MQNSGLRIAAFVNWGLGAVMVRELVAAQDLVLSFVVTRSGLDAPDPWARAVAATVSRHGVPCLDEATTDFGTLRHRLERESIDLVVSHAYGRILPLGVLGAPHLGCMNVHGSLLPAYRGRSPHLWALKNGDRRTGVTFHMMDEGIDTGPIVLQAGFDLLPSDDEASLLEKMKARVKESLLLAIRRLATPGFVPAPQDDGAATFAPRIERP